MKTIHLREPAYVGERMTCQVLRNALPAVVNYHGVRHIEARPGRQYCFEAYVLTDMQGETLRDADGKPLLGWRPVMPGEPPPPAPTNGHDSGNGAER